MLPIPTEWWLRPGQQRLAGRRAQRGGVEAVVPEPARGETLGGRRPARPPERARRAEADVVEQDDQHVRCALRRQQRLDRQGTPCPGPWRRRWSGRLPGDLGWAASRACRSGVRSDVRSDVGRHHGSPCRWDVGWEVGRAVDVVGAPGDEPADRVPHRSRPTQEGVKPFPPGGAVHGVITYDPHGCVGPGRVTAVARGGEPGDTMDTTTAAGTFRGDEAHGPDAGAAGGRPPHLVEQLDGPGTGSALCRHPPGSARRRCWRRGPTAGATPSLALLRRRRQRADPLLARPPGRRRCPLAGRRRRRGRPARAVGHRQPRAWRSRWPTTWAHAPASRWRS